MKNQRRAQIIDAFARVLARHGYAGATIAAIADEAALSPGLLHHHFKNKEEILDELFRSLVETFKQRRQAREADGQASLAAYIDAALALDHRADTTTARCWVGIFAEALRQPALLERFRRYLAREVDTLEEIGQLDSQAAGAGLAFILGALVFGAFAPRKTAGFAAPSLRRLLGVQ